MTSIAARSDAASAHSRGLSDWLLLIVPGAIWGTSFLFIAEGLQAIGPSGVTFVRILVGFLTLGLFPAARRAIPREDWGGLALLGLIWLAFPLSMFPFAEQRVSSALTGMLNGTIPLFTATVEAFHSRRVPPRGVLVGLAIGMLGAVLMAWPSFYEGHSSAIGVLLILAAVICYGFVLPIAVPLQQRHGALAVIWRAQAVALVLTAPLGLPDLLAANWTPAPLLSLLALGAFGTAIAYVVLTISAARVGPTRASATTFLIPGVSLVLGIAVRGEHVAALSVLGAIVCVAGAVLMRRARAQH
ncbi:MAG: DMT family transporter [Gemmatimonadota bacterium]